MIYLDVTSKVLYVQFIALQLFFILWIVLYFTLKRKNENKKSLLNESERLTVLIPAKNEEKVIEETVSRVLKSDYKNMDVIVINDGSTDRTGEILEKFGTDITVITNEKSSGHKALAINIALEKVETPLIAILDSDTLVEPDSFSKLTREFIREDIACVSAIAKVSNDENIVTFFQKLDYIIAMFLRSVQDKFLSSPTIIGVCTIIKTEILKGIGGMPNDTLIEDGDVCAILKKKGYVCRISNTVVGTVVPTTLVGLFKQRKRWIQGRIQVSLKHFDIVMNPKHGAFGMLTFPYEIIIIIMALSTIPCLLSMPFLYFKNANESLITPIKNIVSHFQVSGFTTLPPFDFATVNWMLFLPAAMSILFVIILSIYFFFAVRTMNVRQKIVYYIGLYFTFPYVLFLMVVTLFAALSEIRDRVLQRKSTWGTR